MARSARLRRVVLQPTLRDWELRFLRDACRTCRAVRGSTMLPPTEGVWIDGIAARPIETLPGEAAAAPGPAYVYVNGRQLAVPELRRSFEPCRGASSCARPCTGSTRATASSLMAVEPPTAPGPACRPGARGRPFAASGPVERDRHVDEGEVVQRVCWSSLPLRTPSTRRSPGCTATFVRCTCRCRVLCHFATSFFDHSGRTVPPREEDLAERVVAARRFEPHRRGDLDPPHRRCRPTIAPPRVSLGQTALGAAPERSCRRRSRCRSLPAAGCPGLGCGGPKPAIIVPVLRPAPGEADRRLRVPGAAAGPSAVQVPAAVVERRVSRPAAAPRGRAPTRSRSTGGLRAVLRSSGRCAPGCREIDVAPCHVT